VLPFSAYMDSAATKPRSKRRRDSASEDASGTGSKEHFDPEILLSALAALKCGDFAVRLPLDWVDIADKTADTFSEVVTLNQRMAKELARLLQSVGREGRINQRASLGEVEGTGPQHRRSDHHSRQGRSC
jgi:hypothetical protein